MSSRGVDDSSESRDVETPLLRDFRSVPSRKLRHQGSSVTYDVIRRRESSIRHKRLVLTADADWGDEAVEDEHVAGTSSTAGAITNFAMTLMGCGIMALPRVFASSGIFLGILGMILAYGLTVVSASVLVKISNSTGVMSYAEQVRVKFGSTGSIVLQLSIVLNNMGVMIVYFIMTADLMVGSAPDWSGVLPNALGDHSAPWYLRRWFIILIAATCFEGPLLYLRDLGSLMIASSLSVGCSIFFTLALTCIAIMAAVQGELAHFFFWPDPLLTGSSLLTILCTWVSIIPVIALAFICHFNVLPIKASLKSKDPTVMFTVIKSGAFLISIIYTVAAVSGYMLFGRHTLGNVFTSLTQEYVASLLGKDVAEIVVDCIKIPVVYMLIVTFVLKNWGLRECLSEVLFDSESLRLPLRSFYGITYSVLGIIMVLACLLPDVFIVMKFVGCTACVMFSYIFPGLLMTTDSVKSNRILGGCLLGIGLIFMVVGLYGAILSVM